MRQVRIELEQGRPTPAVYSRIMTEKKSTTLAIVLLALVTAGTATGREIRFPLTVPPPVLREALVRQVFDERGERAVFWGAPGECSFLYLEKPDLELADGRVRVVAAGESRLGTDAFGECMSPLGWSGFVEVLERPRIDGWSLRFDVVDSNLYDENRQKAALGGVLWDRIKDAVTPEFGSVTVDLGKPFAELRDFLPTVVSGEPLERIRPVLASLRPTAASVTSKGLVVDAVFEVPNAPAVAPAPGPEPPLTPAEVEAFNARLERWDAFVTFVVKGLGRMTLSGETREALLATLLDARHGVVEALERPIRGNDPVRRLFVQTWERLRPVADDLARDLPGGESFRLLVFLAAGDALRALDQAGPALGVEVSADGLRRLARMVEPEYAGDPLQYTPAVDPTVRNLFGFGDIEERELGPGSMFELWRWIEPRSAFAEEEDWRHWMVPAREELGGYLQRVGSLLHETAERMVLAKRFYGDRATFFRRLLPATAWQESCWRQFVKRGDDAVYIRSRSGSVGIMQISERVWRGFYDRERLRWDIAYNVGAGAEILRHYQVMVEGRGFRVRSDTMDTFARAVYSAYNGGPSQLERYLDRRRRGARLTTVMNMRFGLKFEATAGGTSALHDGIGACLFGAANT
jgi:hypothetical protein